MTTYGQYCPVARAAELLAERWTPLIVRELLSGSYRFNQIERGLPGIPRSLLAERLRRLERAGVVERAVSPNGRAAEYRLTTAGRGLKSVVEALGDWGARWAFGDPRPEELDPVLLLWRVRRRIHRDRLPPRRVVVQFEFRGLRRGTYWLVLEPADVSLCLQHPGFDVDLVVDADIHAFYDIWLGRMTFAAALRADLVRLEGSSSLARAFPRWLALSPFAYVVRAAMADSPTPASAAG